MTGRAPATDWAGYRRRVLIVPRTGHVDVEMEDDCHHFGVSISHDGNKVLAVETDAERFPWTTCPAAGKFLSARMKGVALDEAATVEDQRQHCTHMYDLFVMGAAHAHNTSPTRYEVCVDDPDESGAKLAVIYRDDREILRWQVRSEAASPRPAPDGQASPPGGNYRQLEVWSKGLEPELQEAGRVLRRGVMVSGGRHFDPNEISDAGDMLHMMEGACFTFQKERASDGKRMRGTLRDFAKEPQRMLGGKWDDQSSGGPDGR